MPIYLVQAPGPRRESVERALGDGAVLLDDLDALGEVERLEPGLLLVDPEVADAADILELARRLAVRGAPARGASASGVSIALLLGPDGAEVGPLSIGPASTLAEARAFVDDPRAGSPAFLDLRTVLAEIARARHDLNNPLTSALAETQLLLLDAEEGEMRHSLEVIQEQLRRIRDMLADTKHLRPPRE